jgi:glycosyltransferase involved in cell wall biosynthesis
MKNFINRFRTPGWLQDHLISYSDWTQVPAERLDIIKKGLERFQCDAPLVTICIPVCNEAGNLLKTLSSLSALELPYATELLFVNNSTDATVDILKYMGVRVINQPKQGIDQARLMGLNESRGTYSLCGDGNTIYPPNWVSAMVDPLQRSAGTKGVYGLHAYIPARKSPRTPWAIYELASMAAVYLRRIKREFLNVHGFNFAFRTKEGLLVKGFEMALTRTYASDRNQADHVIFGEDGRMGRKLGDMGKLHMVTDFSTVAWTSAHRLIREDGSILKAFVSRAKLELNMVGTYIFGSSKVRHTSDDISSTSLSQS